MAVYQPINLYPVNIDIDATVSNNFELQINGTVLKGYSITILLNNDNSVVYNPVIVDISSTPLYNGETLTITIPNTSGMTNGNNYKFYVRLYEIYPAATPTYVQSYEYYFQARSNPTIGITGYSATPTSISEKSVTFQGTYTQSESVALKYYKFSLYNSTQILIKTSGNIYSSKLSWEYDGFLSGQSYYIQLETENQNGTQNDTGLLPFSVSYDEPQIIIQPSVSMVTDKDAVEITWSNAYSIFGKTTGTEPYYEFVEDLFYSGNKCCYIFDNNTIYYDEVNSQDLSISSDNFTGYLFVNLPSGFTGEIIKLENTDTGDSYTVSFDGIRFHYIIGEIHGTYLAMNATGDNYWWKITLLPDSTQFSRVEFGILEPSDTLYPAEDLYPIYTVT